MSVGELKNDNAMMQKRSILHTFFFLIGFSLIFLALGYGSSFVGSLFTGYGDSIRQIGAIAMVFFGLIIIGFFQPKLLMKENRFEFKNRPGGYIGSILIGIAFAAGWTPCTGPILAAVVGMTATNPGSAMFYMISYILGFAIPFFIMSFFIGKLSWIKRNSNKVMKIGGFLMIIMGIVLFFDWMNKITSYLLALFGGWYGF